MSAPPPRPRQLGLSGWNSSPKASIRSEGPSAQQWGWTSKEHFQSSRGVGGGVCGGGLLLKDVSPSSLLEARRSRKHYAKVHARSCGLSYPSIHPSICCLLLFGLTADLGAQQGQAVLAPRLGHSHPLEPALPSPNPAWLEGTRWKGNPPTKLELGSRGTKRQQSRAGPAPVSSQPSGPLADPGSGLPWQQKPCLARLPVHTRNSGLILIWTFN